MTVRFRILVTGTRVAARVELGGGNRCSGEIIKFEVLAENPGGLFMRCVKSWGERLKMRVAWETQTCQSPK